MIADYVKWLKWVGLYMAILTFPVLLIVLGSLHSDLAPGIVIGIAAYYTYYMFRREKENAEQEKPD